MCDRSPARGCAFSTDEMMDPLTGDCDWTMGQTARAGFPVTCVSRRYRSAHSRAEPPRRVSTALDSPPHAHFLPGASAVASGEKGPTSGRALLGTCSTGANANSPFDHGTRCRRIIPRHESRKGLRGPTELGCAGIDVSVSTSPRPEHCRSLLREAR